MVHVQRLVVLAQSSGTPDGSGSIVATVLEMVVKGGWVMVPLGLCSLVALTVVVERLVVTRGVRVAPPSLLAAIGSMRGNLRQGLAACGARPSPLAGVLIAAIRAAAEPREVQERRVAEAGQREVQKLRRRMRLLSALPQAATMLGLLGTVLGMIRTFTVVAASGESLGKTERLAQGIYEAWTATAAGLVIAIPTLLAYHVIMGRIDAAAAALDGAAVVWLESEKGDGESESVRAGPTDAVAAITGVNGVLAEVGA